MSTEKEIASRISRGYRALVNCTNEFPEMVYVAKCSNGSWSKLTYPKFGLGLACFLSRVDSETWYSTPDRNHLTLVEMKKSDAISLAKRENLKYLHLLSDSASTPLNHLKIS